MNKTVKGVKDALQIIALIMVIILMAFVFQGIRAIGNAVHTVHVPTPITDCQDHYQQLPDGSVVRC